MSKYQEPELVDPRRLGVGDQVGCHDAGVRLQLLTGEPDGVDVIWATLRNEPGQTQQVWDRPVPGGSTALQLSECDWRVLVLPAVWARRAIA